MSNLGAFLSEIDENNKQIEELEKQIDELKAKNSEVCKEILPLVSGNKFQYDGNWWLIKCRGGRHFIINFYDVEPGSWLRKKGKNEK